MSKKRKIFDIDLPDSDEMPLAKTPEKGLRRGPMASAISENAESLRQRQHAEATIRQENDALALEFVRLKSEGLITDRVPLDAVKATKVKRDRREGADEDLEELKQSLRDIGLSNPIRVEAASDGTYELVQGMRRLTAFRELHAETGGAEFETIPAVIVVNDNAQTTYRQMVDENLIRKDISFGEMAELARHYAREQGFPDVGEAVGVLFKSASYTKRSYIRAFAELLNQIGDLLEHVHEIPRNLGVDLKRHLEREPGAREALRAALGAARGREAAEELAILRKALGEAAVPAGKAPSAATPRKAKTTFQVPLASGIAKCSASQGRLELRDERDFSAIERGRMERAVAAFFAALDSDDLTRG